MPLEITSIPDREGAALYVVSSHDTATHQKLKRLVDEVSDLSQHQTALLEPGDGDARKILDFYDITEDRLPVAMIVNDDDTLVETWHGAYIPTNASDISYRLSQISRS